MDVHLGPQWLVVCVTMALWYNLKSDMIMPFTVFFLVEDFFIYHLSFVPAWTLGLFFSLSLKNRIGILMGDYMESIDSFCFDGHFHNINSFNL